MDIDTERTKTDWIRFYVLLAISVVIATVGLYRNSVAVVIAAMLIAPLMSPILDAAAALVMGWMGKVLRLILGIGIASILTIALSFSLYLRVGVRFRSKQIFSPHTDYSVSQGRSVPNLVRITNN